MLTDPRAFDAPGVSPQSIQYLDHYPFWRALSWMRRDIHALNWANDRGRHLAA